MSQFRSIVSLPPCATSRAGRWLLALALLAAPLLAQSPPAAPPSTASLPRASAPASPDAFDADLPLRFARTDGFRRGRPTAIRIAPDGHAVFFLRSAPRAPERSLYVFDPADGASRVLLRADDLLGGDAAGDLSAEAWALRERLRLTDTGIVAYGFDAAGGRMLIPLGARLFLVDAPRDAAGRPDWTRASAAAQPPPGDVPLGTRFVRGLRVRELPVLAGYPNDPRLSPDGRQLAYVADGDLYVADLELGTSVRLTARESTDVTFGLAEFVAQEEMDRRRGYWWSPDGQKLVVQRNDVAAMARFHIADPYDPAAPPRIFAYPRAGGVNADVRLGVIAADGSGDIRWIDGWDRARYPYLTRVVWTASGPLTIVVQNRAQTELRVLQVDVRTGATRELLTERDEAWLNLDPAMPTWLPGGDFLWTTERNGAWQLERRASNGGLRHALTPVDLGYRDLLTVDVARGEAVVTASDDPTERHLVRVRLDGTGVPRRMTATRGVHDAVFGGGAGRKLQVLIERQPDAAPRWTVYDAVDGQMLGVLPSVAEAPPSPARPDYRIVQLATSPSADASSADGPAVEAFHAVLLRPRDFDPAQRYPVLVHIYGGPLKAMVKRDRSLYALEQWLADQGFIVVAIDGRGTPYRGRAWERAIHHRLIDVALTDQVGVLRALGLRLPELDLDRVGIFGWSFGGYASALAVMQQPDVFHAAVAGAPVADWRDYDTHYTERYLGSPQDAPARYDAQSVLTWAPRLTRPLLLIHGTADDNVYLTHALKTSDVLTRAGIAHDFLPLAGATHRVRDPQLYATRWRRTLAFFRTHLGAPIRRPAARPMAEDPRR
ncbi:MAG: DPP IV N-terminal domain-containing protein [Acidobacteriota bacterium]